MKIKYYTINPGGNITAIVPGKFARKNRLKIAKNILSKNKEVEQVGFWTSSSTVDAKLEMAGGEFCGNALRSMGALLAYLNNLKGNFIIKSFGVKRPVLVKSSKSYSTVSLPLDSFRCKKDLCILPGIKHLIIDRDVSNSEAKNVLKVKNLLKEKAAGIISFTRKTKNQYEINPIVYVRDTKTLYNETACASGTLALAYSIYKKLEIKTLYIRQPSGETFKTLISNKKISLEGPILSIEKNSI